MVDPRFRGRVGSSTAFYARVTRIVEERRQKGEEQRDWTKGLMRPREEAEPESGLDTRKSPARQRGPYTEEGKRSMERVAALPSHSRKPGGALREGQRTGSRRIPVPNFPVIVPMVFSLFLRRKRGGGPFWMWHLRRYATIAVALSVPKGTTIKALCSMTVAEILRLRMPFQAWTMVVRWLEMRCILGSKFDAEPWLTYLGSNGVPRQVSTSVPVALAQVGLPGWRLSKLLRATWDGYCGRTMSFDKVKRRLIAWKSPLRPLAA